MTDDNPQAVPLITISHNTALLARLALRYYRKGHISNSTVDELNAIQDAISELEPFLTKKVVCVYCGNETVNTFPSQVPLCAWHETPDMFL